MRTIFRYEIPVDDQVHPVEVLATDRTGGVAPKHVAARRPDAVELWVEGDTDLEPVTVNLLVVGTGHPIPDSARHLGTGPAPLGLVWHLYEIP